MRIIPVFPPPRRCVWLLGAFLLLTLRPPAAAGIVNVWIDTDPSLGLPFHDADDGFALVQAFGSAGLRVRGVSVSYGNTTLARAIPIARRLVEVSGGKAADVEVFPGAAGPGARGRETAASGALTAALARERLTYLALGPLTNLATVLQRRPELAGQLERVIFLGGRQPGERFRVGRWLPYEFHDANFDQDPPAAGLVLRSGVPLTLVPAPTAFAEPLLLTPADLRRLGRAGGAPGRLLRAQAGAWLRLWQGGFALRGGPLFDSLAVLAAARPELFATENTTAAISTDILGSNPVANPAVLAGRGPRFYLLHHAAGFPVQVLLAVDPAARTTMLADMLRAGEARDGKPLSD